MKWAEKSIDELSEVRVKISLTKDAIERLFERERDEEMIQNNSPYGLNLILDNLDNISAQIGSIQNIIEHNNRR